jgi:hypothetical protein
MIPIPATTSDINSIEMIGLWLRPSRIACLLVDREHFDLESLSQMRNVIENDFMVFVF